ELLEGAEVDPEGAPRAQENRGYGGRAQARQGSPEGQPDALARVDLEPHEPAGQARDAPRDVPLDGRDAERDRQGPPRRSSGARPRPPRRGPPRPDPPGPAGPPQPAPRAPAPLNLPEPCLRSAPRPAVPSPATACGAQNGRRSTCR